MKEVNIEKVVMLQRIIAGLNERITASETALEEVSASVYYPSRNTDMIHISMSRQPDKIGGKLDDFDVIHSKLKRYKAIERGLYDRIAVYAKTLPAKERDYLYVCFFAPTSTPAFCRRYGIIDLDGYVALAAKVNGRFNASFQVTDRDLELYEKYASMGGL